MEHRIKDNEVFVFGSNLAGRHGAGAAKTAHQLYGAKYGCGVGQQGRSYAIPTKDKNLTTLPISEIKKYVEEFLQYAAYNSHDKFFLTKIGCGLAGYKDKDIAPLFKVAPSNIRKPPTW